MIEIKPSTILIMKNTIVRLAACVATISIMTAAANAQYIHPNQAGRMGGNTTDAGKGAQVVTSTYYGTAGTAGAQGTIYVNDKNGKNQYAITDFQGYPSDGSYPWYTTPQQFSDGNLYGASYVGGSANWGAIYKFETSGGSCTKSLIHSNTVGDGSPGNYANVNELSDGRLYAVMTYGGATDAAGYGAYGTIVSMKKDGTDKKVLHAFKHTSATVPYTAGAIANSSYTSTFTTNPATRYDGGWPAGFVVEGADGKVYGTTVRGAIATQGTVWRMDKDGSNYEIIHVCDALARNLNNATSSTPATYIWGPAYPWGNLAQDANGRLYMATYEGGANAIGGLWSFNPDGTDFRILQSGTTADGYNFYRGPLVINGAVYGTSLRGGTSGYGTVWKWDIAAKTYSKLHSFNGTTDGGWIWAGLAYDGTHLYGTAIDGGGAGNVGTLYRIKPDGTDFGIVHRFSNSQLTNCGVAGKVGLYAYYPSAERVTFADIDQACAKTCVVPTSNGDASLPVYFGEVSSSIKNSTLYVNWSTLTETNNDRFEIEASADGVSFTTIGTVKSKAENGKSDVLLQYEFSKSAAGGAIAIGFGLLALGGAGFFANRKRRVLFALAAIVGLSVFYMGCQKVSNEVGENGKIFVRIAQIDKDGTKSYSKVVTVTK